MLIGSLLVVGTIGIFRRYIPLESALLAFFRGAIGAAALAAFMLARGGFKGKRVPPKIFLGLLLNGMFVGVNWLLLFEAFNHTTVAKATLCYYLAPTIVLLLSPLVFRERLTVKKSLCAAVSLAGMMLVSGVFAPADARPQDGKGVLLALGAACFYATVVMLNKKLGDVDAYLKTVVQLAGAAIALLPYLLATGAFAKADYSGHTLLLVLVVGLIHTGLAYVLYFGSMSGLKAQTIAVLSYIDPVTALLVSALILREPVTALALVGAALIIGAAVVSELPGKKRHAR
ncbi:MAG: EamA family transporter [Clostridia bacterium]|nr:EamA family transporter [Clostridia bacterium]